MDYKNKGMVNIHDQEITEIDNGNVNLIELPVIKDESGFPSDTVGKSAVLIVYDKDKFNKYLYILIDETGREYYLKHEARFDVKQSKFILLGNQVLDKWWQSIAMEDDPNTSYQDITTVINKTAPRYNPDEVNRLVDQLAHRNEEVHFFKRWGANNFVGNIHQFHQFPRINSVGTYIRMTVNGRNNNTDYRIWYHNWQGGWESAIVMAAWRNAWATQMRFGNYSDWEAEDVEIQHSSDRIFVRHRENGGLRDREVMMHFDMLWKHLGNMGSGGTVSIPSQAIDVMIVPRFVSMLDLNSSHMYPAWGSGRRVPLRFNPFIGKYFSFGLPCYFVPAGVDYGIHGTSYSLTSRSNRQLTFGPGNISWDLPEASTHHYEVWWR